MRHDDTDVAAPTGLAARLAGRNRELGQRRRAKRGAGMVSVVNAVVQARMGSTRLPGKVLRDLGGLPVLGWVVRALRAVDGVDDVVIATSTLPGDDVIEVYAEQVDVACVRGPEEDVLARFVLALERHPADAVVRITADCPLVDPALVEQVVAAWRTDRRWDYVATTLVRTLPRGLDVELVSAAALRELTATATGFHRQHVTSLLYTEPAGRRLLGLSVAPDASDLRVTLDTDEDWTMMSTLVSALGTRVLGWEDVVGFLRAHPDVVALNSDVSQKALEAG
ncbi:MAG: glycosyltransferase family protein [Nocardioidaceae bacterium]